MALHTGGRGPPRASCTNTPGASCPPRAGWGGGAPQPAPTLPPLFTHASTPWQRPVRHVSTPWRRPVGLASANARPPRQRWPTHLPPACRPAGSPLPPPPPPPPPLLAVGGEARDLHGVGIRGGAAGKEGLDGGNGRRGERGRAAMVAVYRHSPYAARTRAAHRAEGLTDGHAPAKKLPVKKESTYATACDIDRAKGNARVPRHPRAKGSERSTDSATRRTSGHIKHPRKRRTTRGGLPAQRPPLAVLTKPTVSARVHRRQQRVA